MTLPITVVIGLAHGRVSCTVHADALPHLRSAAADPAVPLPAAAQPTRPPEALLARAECRTGTAVAGRCQVEPAGPAAAARPSEHSAPAAGARGRGSGSWSQPQEGNPPEAGGNTLEQGTSSGRNARAGVHQARRGTPGPGALRRQHRPHQIPDRDAPDGELVAGVEANPEASIVAGSEFSYRTVAGAWRIQWRSSRPLHPLRLREALADIAVIALRGRGHVMLAGCPNAVERDGAGGSALCFIGVSDRWHVIHDRLRHAELTDEEMR